MSDDTSARKPHVVMDLPSRQWKAMKIERLLGLESRPGPLRLLEIGVGSGGIASYFGTHPSGKYEVHGVDVLDNRMTTEGYRFTRVDGVELPFDDAYFDIVLTNHVIEHVGDESAQRAHLQQARRVMKLDGVGYLAVPNRWMLVEPHYRLAFLSWFPVRWRSPYLRLAGRGREYDCRPLETRELEGLFEACGLACENLCVEAMRATLAIERPGSLGDRLLSSVPDRLLAPWRAAIPTLIYAFRHAGREHG